MPWATIAALTASAMAAEAAGRVSDSLSKQQAATRQANMDIEHMVAQGRRAVATPTTCPNCGAPKAEHICAYCKTQELT